MSENWLWEFDERSLEPVDDLGFENRVIFSRAVGIGEAIGAREPLCVLRKQICSVFIVGPRIEDGCKAGRTQRFEVGARYLRTDRELRCHVDEFEHARHVSHSSHTAGSSSVPAPSYVFHIGFDAARLEWFFQTWANAWHTRTVAKMDHTDARILEVLQADAALSAKEVAQRIGLDEKSCADRIRRLEDDGVILRRVTLLDPRKVGAGMTVFVAITTPEHSQEWLDQFHSAVEGFPEVMEFYRMSGQVDYLLRVVVPDIDAYDRFYKKLIAAAKLKDVSSTFAIEQIKSTTELPLSAAD